MDTKEIVLNTLSVDNDISAKTINTQDIVLNRISVKNCINAINDLSNCVEITIGDEDFILVGKECDI